MICQILFVPLFGTTHSSRKKIWSFWSWSEKANEFYDINSESRSAIGNRVFRILEIPGLWFDNRLITVESIGVSWLRLDIFSITVVLLLLQLQNNDIYPLECCNNKISMNLIQIGKLTIIVSCELVMHWWFYEAS